MAGLAAEKFGFDPDRPRSGFDFFRKERPELFEARFTKPISGGEAYTLNSNLIFRAKNFSGQKNFLVKFNGRSRSLVATVMGSEIIVKSQPGESPPVILRLSEANMADALKNKPLKEDSLIYRIAEKLCKDHATSSTSSPLVSGCIVNNFDKSKTYDGYKLHLMLKHRQPFVNPFVSGLEKEYFMIGQVLDTDCEIIRFLGRTNENVTQVVNFFSSRIARPS